MAITRKQDKKTLIFKAGLSWKRSHSRSWKTWTRRRCRNPIGAEIEGNLKLLDLQLENVEGGKMEVHGFGPLNWLAGRKVSDLVQETLLQEVEQELRQGLEEQLEQLAIYFQAVEKESPGLVPIGLLVH